jgi:hypothetical protein
VGGASRDLTAIVVDQSTGEIHFFRRESGRFDSLMFTGGSYSHENKLEDVKHVDPINFYLYSYQDHQATGFLLTKCDETNLRGISCEILPFRYLTASFKTAQLTLDDRTQEIKVTIDGQLVFSYDDHPHCYVENCLIPGKK